VIFLLKPPFLVDFQPATFDDTGGYQREGKPGDRESARDLVLNFLIAGRDTTAQAPGYKRILSSEPRKL